MMLITSCTPPIPQTIKPRHMPGLSLFGATLSQWSRCSTGASSSLLTLTSTHCSSDLHLASYMGTRGYIMTVTLPAFAGRLLLNIPSMQISHV
ncbi:hypothetical protein PCO87_15885 [Pectobacteriaceae bacterium C52]|nr:hypothetical protein PCO87_15885 [Pectobacteriaceae bacterium C52]